MIIAIDAMGGDLAPKAPIEGALKALPLLQKDVTLMLFGDREAMEACLSEDYDRDRIRLVHCSEQISCEEAPVSAVRSKKDSSLVKAAEAVSKGEADCFVSAGSSGAVLTAGTLILRRIKGIQRPALATLIPNLQGGYTLLLDSGANADCKAGYLVEFAYMGSAYMTGVMGIDKPRIGLLNNGSEEEKGNLLTKEAYALLKGQAGLNFAGNCEARELMSGDYDVLVCDGFSGNVLLKGTEGTAKAITAMLKTELMGSLRGSLGGLLAKPALKNLKKRMDYKEVGGAPLLGVNGAMIKAHGSSDGKAFMNALLQGEKLVNGQVNKTLEGYLSGNMA